MQDCILDPSFRSKIFRSFLARIPGCKTDLEFLPNLMVKLFTLRDSYLIKFWWSVAYSLAPRLDNWDSEFDLLFICIAVFRARQGSGIYSSGTGKELAYRCHCKAIGKLDAETFSKSQSTAPLSHGLTYVVEGFKYSFGSLAYWYPDGLSNFVNGLDWYPAGNISPE